MIAHLFRVFLCFVLLFSPVSTLAEEGQKDLEILRVTPTGEDVPPAQQIVIEFSRPVVPIGRMERTAEEVGVKIQPSLNCQWRWLNTTSLSCNLDEKDAMLPATRYVLQVEPKIKAEDGASVKQAAEYSFITQRPDIEYASMRKWLSPSSPLIRVVFTQPVSKSSAEAHMFMTAEGTGTRYVIKASIDEYEPKLPDYVFMHETKSWLRLDPQTQKSDDQATKIDGEEARRVWLIEPVEVLPEGITAKLMVEAGLVSAIGTEKGVVNREVVAIETFPEFRAEGIKCRTNAGAEVLIPLMPTEAEKSLCNPLRPISLTFTSPVLRSQVKDNAVITPDLTGGKKDINPWGDENRDWSSLEYPRQKDQLYYVDLPYGLKAAQEYKVKFEGQGLQDEFGRSLSAPIELAFSTDHRNPNFVLPHRDAVIESGIDSELPFYVNNLNSYAMNFRSITGKESLENQTFTRNVENIPDIQYAIPFGLRDMLGGKSGAVFGYLSTDPVAPEKWEGDYRLFAQVTPWQAHLKLGHFSSLIWVTDMQTGEAVSDVSITVYKDAYTTMSAPKDILATVKTDSEGLAVLPGTDTLDPYQELLQMWRDEDPRLFVRLDKDGDMGLLPLAENFSLSTWGFAEDGTGSWTRNKYGHMKSWGMTAQGIYRAGDTMQYKIFLRHQDDKGLIPPPAEGKYELEIIDPTGKTVDFIEGVKFSEFGAFSGEYKIPESAAVGWYDFKLIANFTDGKADPQAEGQDEYYEPKGVYNLIPVRVLVSDFTPAPFRVTTEIGAEKFRPADTMNIESRATLHSGGSYGEAAVRATVTLQSRVFTSDDPVAAQFTFGSSRNGLESMQLHQKSATLNDKGEWTEPFIIPQESIYYGRLEVESAVQDDRGKSIASLAHADYIGVDRFVGLKSPQWFYESQKSATLQTIVVDEDGKPIEDTGVSISIDYEEISVAKVKGAGNAYLSDITRTWKNVALHEKTSVGVPTDFVFTPEKAGTYRVTAKIADQKGREHTTEIMLWASGSDYVQWNDQNENALSIIPEKKEYKVGDRAKFLVKNPFPGAKALVTVERYGILDRFVMTLEGSAPVLEIPVKPDYLPGFYLSAVVVSPRVEQPPPEKGQVDMGKPTFRMGYVTIPVNDPHKEITVDVKTEQDVYQPRDTVKISLHAQPRNAPEQPQPIEMAVAVLDESVFDLIHGGSNAFDPYKGFFGLESLDMRNYSILYRLVGRQKFEKKGANAGGDGGGVDMRNLFKFVSYWNSSLKTDENGRANIEFEVPDNLTGWRVLAVATTPSDRMGLGEGTFKVNRPTEVRPVMPNVVREGDTFSAGFSVMNRTDNERTLTVSIKASGDVKGELAKEETVTLAPYKRQTIYLPLQAGLLPVEREEIKGAIAFTVKAEDAVDADGMEFSLPVLKTRVFDVAANYGTTTENKVEEHIAFPSDIYTDAGDVSVVLSPSVIANLTGAFRYMRDYPYICWEQILTQGVMAAHYQELKPWIPESFVWKDSETLTQATLDRAANYQAPNGGMTYFGGADDRVDPYLSAYTAIAFGWLKADGYKIPTDVETKLHNYLLNFLRQDASPDFYQEGMTSTVRAVALAALGTEGKITAQDVTRYQPHLKQMNLFGKAHFLKAALQFQQTRPAAREAADMIFATGNETGGKFMFSEILDDGYLRLLATPLRDNCAVLSSFLSYKALAEGEKLIGDKPFKLVRMITQSREKRDHWENTQENMFCMNALVEYSKAYETVKPAMKITASLDEKNFGEASFKDFRDAPTTLVRPIEESDVGQKKNLILSKEGDGRFYYAARLRYASKSGFDKDVNAGIEVAREYSVNRDGKWTLLKAEESIKRGDLVRVDLFVRLPSARNFVVVDDPMPSGLETVNRDLATASTVDDAKAQYDEAGGSMWFKFGDWMEYNFSFWSFYHKELRHDSARFYADWLPAGNYHLSYMAQAIADGDFAAPPTHAGEMYDSDVYGRTAQSALHVKTE